MCRLGLALLLCVAGAACKGERERGTVRSGEVAAEAGVAPSSANAALSDGGDARGPRPGDLVPDWRVRVPSEPGMPVLQASVGPVLVGSSVVVGSSAVGFVALDRTTGELLWQRRGEERPGTPMTAGNALWLPGRCAHLRRSTPDAELASGCIEKVGAANGRLEKRLWITLPAGAAQDVDARALGRTTDGSFLWASGNDLWLVDAGGAAARVIEGESPVMAATEVGSLYLVASERRVVMLRRRPTAKEGGSRKPAFAEIWQQRFVEPAEVGFAGPVMSGAQVAWIRDGVLESRDSEGGRVRWTAEGRYAYVAGSLCAGSGALLAVALDDGISPARVAPRDGRRLARGTSFAGIQVLAAAFAGPCGQSLSLAAAVRLDASARRDAIALFAIDGALHGTWHLPVAPRVRADPPGLSADSQAAFLFYDGRVAARLPMARE